MDEKTTSHTPPREDTARDSDSTFNPQWQASDATTLFHPNALPKITRAWERKPLSPFSRSRVRVGKVWKRPAANTRAPRYAVGEQAVVEREAKRQRRRSSGVEFKKPVKKMCLDSAFGLAPSVVGWEACESPARKIVTRSNAIGQEMLALDEEDEVDGVAEPLGGEEEEVEGDVTVEILDEDGQVLDVDPEQAVRDLSWEDEDAQGSEELDDAATLSATFEGAADAVVQEDPFDASLPTETENEEPTALTEAHVLPPPGPSAAEEPTVHMDHVVSSQIHEQQQLQPVLQAQELVLPEGFVSPVKRRIAKIGKRKSLNSRRRTLPVQFAPAGSYPDASEERGGPEEDIDVEQNAVSYEPEGEYQSATTEQVTSDDAVTSVAEQDEQQWEDVLSSDSEDDVMNDEAALPIAREEIDNDFALPIHQHAPEPERLKSPLDHVAAAKLPSSPIPSIEGQHPRLPLRRSPRRKSSSPLKQRTIIPSSERSHLIAFTPLKDAPLFLQRQSSDALDAVDDIEETDHGTTSPLERALSAPPEEPCMSERKISRPRVSDDTALIQAFLDRAAESKGPPALTSVSKRESLSNRRDSDAVRQALASPAKPADVLIELDPNSPSPRKSAVLPLSNVFDDVIEEAAKKAGNIDNGTEEEEDGGRTRRSGRTARKSVQTTPAPMTTANKISIRGPNGDGVVLKRTEAQERILLTRNNTRKNKGGAVLPPLRLGKMAMTFGQLPNGVTEQEEKEEENSEGEKAKGEELLGKAVRWAETLVEFYQGPNVEANESSVLSDELNASAEVDCDKTAAAPASIESASTAIVSAPPPAETPSKPKIRKLKAPRTAAAPGKASATPAPASAPDVKAPPLEKATTTSASASAKPSSQPQTKRRSRIATPAKGLTNASLLPPMDLDPQPVVPAVSEVKATAPAQHKKRKAPISKLPAPASTATTTSSLASSTALGQGKENSNLTTSLLLSPPKKKAAPPSSAPGAKPGFAVAPKLDFSGKTRFEPPVTSAADDDATVPGLLSPAKKGGRTKMVPGLGTRKDESSVDETKSLNSSLGMSSPAKKRTRRAV